MNAVIHVLALNASSIQPPALISVLEDPRSLIWEFYVEACTNTVGT